LEERRGEESAMKVQKVIEDMKRDKGLK